MNLVSVEILYTSYMYMYIRSSESQTAKRVQNLSKYSRRIVGGYFHMGTQRLRTFKV